MVVPGNFIIDVVIVEMGEGLKEGGRRGRNGEGVMRRKLDPHLYY
jgi:hypothetical protein